MHVVSAAEAALPWPARVIQRLLTDAFRLLLFSLMLACCLNQAVFTKALHFCFQITSTLLILATGLQCLVGGVWWGHVAWQEVPWGLVWGLLLQALPLAVPPGRQPLLPPPSGPSPFKRMGARTMRRNLERLTQQCQDMQSERDALRSTLVHREGEIASLLRWAGSAQQVGEGRHVAMPLLHSCVHYNIAVHHRGTTALL